MLENPLAASALVIGRKERKHRPALVARQPQQRLDALGFQYRIRRTQGSRPTCRDTRHRAPRLAPRKARARRTALNTGVVASRQGNRRWRPGRRRRHGPDGLCQACRARITAVECDQSDGCCGKISITSTRPW